MVILKRILIPLISLVIICGICLPTFLPAEAKYQISNQIKLTQAEQDFILEHPVIRLGVDPTFVPYEFFDKDGKYKGIAADYINLLYEKTGLQLEVAEGLTWTEAYEKAVNKELDVLPCVAQTKEREKYFLFSESYYNFQRAVFFNQSETSIKSLKDLYGKTTAVQENSSHYGFLQKYPEIKLSLYSKVEDALQAVSAGDESSYVGNLATATFLIREKGITNIKYLILDTDKDDPTQALHFAVRNDWPELVGIINKVLASITEEEKIAINNKWISIENNRDYTKIIQAVCIAGVLILIILVVSFFWIIRLRKEVSRRMEAEAGYIAAKEEAEKANQTKSMFLARMSHEIRTPLSAIMGMAYLIKKTEITITQSSYLEKLTHAARNMLDIINDILDFSKIESGKIEIEHISFNMDEVIKKVINIVSVKVEEQGIDFTMNKAPDMPLFFWGDPVRLEQILLNLVNNAVKFTDKGVVSLSVKAAAIDENTYSVSFDIKDTGIGMTKEQLDRLFVPFDQGDSSINRRYGGTGLGLSIVKNLTELMNGKVEVSSVYNEGSNFNITIPLETDKSKTQHNVIFMGVECFANIHALIIDKNENSRGMLTQYCSSFGINIEASSSEDEAVQRMYKMAVEEEKPYDLLIVDYKTPKSGGIEFITRIKRISEPDQRLKYILVIPLSQENLLDEAEAAGIDFCITKPVIPSLLYNGIIELCGIKPPENRETADVEDIPTATKKYHILLVEDNKTNQFIAQTIMEQAGFTVSKADNGEEGYKYFLENSNTIDLILMDIHMPVMNGYEAADIIKKAKPDIPIIAMTADIVSGVIETCRSHGMENYVSKPFEPEHFIKTILNVLSLTQKSMKPDAKPDIKTEESSGSVLDMGDGLKRIGGDHKFYLLVLQAFQEENTLVSDNLSEKINTGDYQGAIQIVHKIKSSAGGIGAKSLHEAATALQKALKEVDTPEILKWSNEFKTLLEKLLKEIADIILKGL